MRSLFILMGAPGSGKSSLLHQLKLDVYSICPDSLRLLMGSPAQDLSGNPSISQKNDKEVWKMVFSILEKRMMNGDFTIIDATHTRTQSINDYKQLCSKYGYRAYVVDFRSSCSIEELIKRNELREPNKRVPEHVISKMIDRLTTIEIPGWVTVINPEDMRKVIFDIKIDLTGIYKKIYVIGDVHGCYSPLENLMSKIFSSENCYIFLGDYFDRGIQNVEVFRYIQSIIHNDNVLLLEGNHERHIRKYIDLEGSVNNGRFPEPFIKTILEFEKSGITLKELTDFVKRLGQLAYFKYHDNSYVMCHGGIPTYPSLLTPTHELIHGVGRYEDGDIVDMYFQKNTSGNTYMVRGHRNVSGRAIMSTINNRVFVLSDKVEYGHELRSLELDGNSVRDIYIKNDVYDGNLTYTKHSMCKSELYLLEPSQITSLMRNSDRIRESTMMNGLVSSFNMNRKAFWNRDFDQLSVTARGLFISNVDNSVVAKSFPKFFNWGEINELSDKVLERTLKFPVRLYRKYNGFLAIVSLFNGELFVASKSSSESEFANMAKHILMPYCSEDLLRFLDKKTLLFEIIDPVRDPHIIKYTSQKCVLIGGNVNTFQDVRLKYEQLVEIAGECNLPVKNIDHEFNSWDELLNFKKLQDSMDVCETSVEGWVIEDSGSIRLKYKTNYYKFWRYIRELMKVYPKLGIDGILTRKMDNRTAGLVRRFPEFFNMFPDNVDQTVIKFRDWIAK